MKCTVERVCTGVAALAVFAATACGAAEDDAGDSEPRALALFASVDGATTLLFAAREHQPELPEIAGAARLPKDFPWVAISIPDPDAAALASEEGLSVDLARSEVPVVFAQVYRDVCNPAADDNTQCWHYERYTAGEKGLSGSISARLAEASADARFEVVWEGMTDRFGDPLQWHRHITSAGVHAAAVEVPR